MMKRRIEGQQMGTRKLFCVMDIFIILTSDYVFMGISICQTYLIDTIYEQFTVTQLYLNKAV